MNKTYIKILVPFLCAISVLDAQAQHDSKPAQSRSYIERRNMDLNYKPGDDFYRYASGNWIKNNPVPAKETRWGTFNELFDLNIKSVQQILNDAAADRQAKAGSPARRVGDFFAAAMDSSAIEKKGSAPITPDLQKIRSLSDKRDVLDYAAAMRTRGEGSPFFAFSVVQDRKNVSRMVPQLGQGGTTLPDRDYYLKDDNRSRQIQTAYREYIAQLFKLTGTPDEQARKNAETIFSFEKDLAQAQMTRTEMRDPYRTYNKFSVSDLRAKTPGLEWSRLLPIMKVNGKDSVLVNSPDFFVALDKKLAATSTEDLKTYLQWNILKGSASYLNTDFVNASFAFNQVLTGQKVQTPRWQRMASLTDNMIGELLGQIYVQKHFKPEAKARMQELVSNLVKAYEIRIKNLEWMSDATKEKALAKLHAFTPKIAYPDKWKTYDGLAIDRNNFFANVRNAAAWSYADMVGQLGKPVDKSRWGMTPPTVNAYYSPVNNEIVFPAGILQFPFFDPNADDAVNYGGIGAVIGHEISHGFDDSGSQYDKDGNLRNWWTDEDRQRFMARATQLQQQFNAYTVLDSLKVNGKLTLGENIGDLGGLSAAYEAFKMTPQGKSNVKIDGLTPDQRFFLSWAQVWKGNIRPETAAQLLITDTHSPGEYRTIGPLVNMDAWYEAFNVKPGDKLYRKPEERVRIW